MPRLVSALLPNNKLPVQLLLNENQKLSDNRERFNWGKKKTSMKKQMLA
jgi:ribosomal protein L39E